MCVRVYDAPAGGENRLYYFTPEEIVTTKKVGANIPTGTLHERTMIQDGAPTLSAPIIADSSAGGNTQSAQTAGGLSGSGTDGGKPLPRAGEPRGERRYLPKAGETEGALPKAVWTQKNASTGEAGNNTRLTETDIQAYLNTGKTGHTRNKKARLLESGKSPILTTAKAVKDFILSAIGGKSSGEVRGYGKVGTLSLIHI